MLSPLLLVAGVAAFGAFLFKKAPNDPGPKSTVDALIDPAEKSHPNAENARFQIAQAMATNSISQMTATAEAVEHGLKMPRSAANLRAWRDMARAGGNAVAGDLPGLFQVGAAPKRSQRRGPEVPEWLKFQATQSKLAGDPSFIRATAETMRRMGYRGAAEIHLRTADELERSH